MHMARDMQAGKYLHAYKIKYVLKIISRIKNETTYGLVF